jgi:hypothetical protein
MKTKIFLTIILFSFLEFSCQKSFLDQKPISTLSKATFYQTQADVDQAVNGVYNTLLAYPDVFYINLSECRSGNFYTPTPQAQRDYFSIASFNLDASLAMLQTGWALGYNTINRANLVLENIGHISFTSDALRKQYIAEAKFLRAMAYFELVKVFGGVPLIDHTVLPDEALTIKRSPIATIYDFITQNMNDAIVDLPATYASASTGKITSVGAKAMLARVYLTMAGYPLNKTENYAKSRALLENIIAQEVPGTTKGYGVKFAPTYKSLFNSDNDNTYYLFEVQYISGGFGLGNPVPGETLPVDINATIAKYGAYYISGTPSTSLVNSYEAGDQRLASTISTTYVNTKNSTITSSFFSKFLEPGKTILSSSDWPINFPIIRYADVLLMEAEIQNEQAPAPPATAIALLNRIRNRAGLANIAPATTADFRLAMENERRHEFAWEGLYWPDLVRTNRAIPVLNTILPTEYNRTIDQTQLIYPIPRSEIQILPGLYDQNPGYNN